jgi:hypothetical protein
VGALFSFSRYNLSPALVSTLAPHCVWCSAGVRRQNRIEYKQSKPRRLPFDKLRTSLDQHPIVITENWSLITMPEKNTFQSLILSLQNFWAACKG